MSYNIEQRKTKIIELLHQNEEVKVSELSKLFDISEVTVRFDLDDLESKGLLRRIYGGAVSSNKLYVNMDLKQRYTTNETAKRAIAERVATLIDDNDTIMMNSGTTITYVLHAIRAKKNISIVTNSIAVATEAASFVGFNVILLGGFIETKYQFTYGDDAISQLSKYHASKLILSVDGIHPESGLTLFYSNETEISRQMINMSDKVIIAADACKIGRCAFANIAALDCVDTIVTSKIEDEKLDIISTFGIEIIRA